MTANIGNIALLRRAEHGGMAQEIHAVQGLWGYVFGDANTPGI
jgi:hypothetical protein